MSDVLSICPPRSIVPVLGPHQFAARIERRPAKPVCPAPLADDLYFKTGIGRGQRRRNIAESQRVIDAMPERARGDPTHRLAVMPDRLIADRIGIGGIHIEGEQAQCPAALLLLGRRRAPDERALLEIDESIETRFEWPVDGAVFARPAAEALFNAHGIERAAAE